MPLVQLANGPLSATGPAAEVELDEIDLGYVLNIQFGWLDYPY